MSDFPDFEGLGIGSQYATAFQRLMDAIHILESELTWIKARLDEQHPKIDRVEAKQDALMVVIDHLLLTQSTFDRVEAKLEPINQNINMLIQSVRNLQENVDALSEICEPASRIEIICGALGNEEGIRFKPQTNIPTVFTPPGPEIQLGPYDKGGNKP